MDDKTLEIVVDSAKQTVHVYDKARGGILIHYAQGSDALRIIAKLQDQEKGKKASK